MTSAARQQVIDAAARGQHHPDPDTASAAYRWATHENGRALFVLPKVVLLGLLDGVLGGGGASGAAPWLRWRHSRAIRRLGPPADADPGSQHFM